MGLFKSVSQMVAPQVAGNKMIYDWTKNPENIIGSLPYVGKNYWNQKNYEQQQQKLGWDQFVQYQTWGREDNATQRRVADLKAAGLSPVLAAGQPAQAGAVVSTTAPQRQHDDMSDTALKVMSLLTQKANIETQESQRKLMQLQGQQATAGALKTLAEIEEIPSRIQQNRTASARNTAAASDHLQSAATRSHDLDIARKTGLTTRPGAAGGFSRDLRLFMENATGRTRAREMAEQDDRNVRQMEENTQRQNKIIKENLRKFHNFMMSNPFQSERRR